MDANKKKLLRMVGYGIEPSCGLCKHATFAGRDDFGVCTKYTYRHAKHSGPPRPMSIYRAGVCKGGGFEQDERRVEQLGSFGDFVN